MERARGRIDRPSNQALNTNLHPPPKLLIENPRIFKQLIRNIAAKPAGQQHSQRLTLWAGLPRLCREWHHSPGSGREDKIQVAVQPTSVVVSHNPGTWPGRCRSYDKITKGNHFRGILVKCLTTSSAPQQRINIDDNGWSPCSLPLIDLEHRQDGPQKCKRRPAGAPGSAFETC